jgi:hypothetical protein
MFTLTLKVLTGTSKDAVYCDNEVPAACGTVTGRPAGTMSEAPSDTVNQIVPSPWLVPAVIAANMFRSQIPSTHAFPGSASALMMNDAMSAFMPPCPLPPLIVTRVCAPVLKVVKRLPDKIPPPYVAVAVSN